MTDHDDTSEVLEIDFEVGHTSTIRAEPTTSHNPPRTHDWKVYLRSADVHGDLNCLIQRCVFYLHREFPNFKRELKSTPFAIQESGYAGFDLPIEIFFKTKKEPKKFRIEYVLDLHTNIEGHPYRQKESYLQKYRCTFVNPDPDLRQKILDAGGKIKDNHSISSKNNDSGDDEKNSSVSSEPTVRQSPPNAAKRPFSPAASANSKKVKVESSMNNQKKKQPSVIKNENSSKTTVTTISGKKQGSTLSTKTSPVSDEKVTKIPPAPSQAVGSAEELALSKPRPSFKLKAEQDTKPPSTMINKKKEPVSSPSKTIPPLKKPIAISTNKAAQKPLIKLEPIPTMNKSPSNLNIKRESSPNTTSSNSTNGTVLISSLKKIPKKVVPPPLPPPPPPMIDKRTRSPLTPPSSSRNQDRDSHRHPSSASKSSSSSKRDRPTSIATPPSSSINNSGSSRSSSSSNRSGKHSASSSSHRARSRSRSRSRSHSRNRSSHPTHHSSRSHHSSNSSRHSSQQKDRSNRHSSPSHHSSSVPKSTSSSSSHHHNHRRATSSKSTRSPSRSAPSHVDPPASSSTDLIKPPSIQTPQSQPNSVEPPVIASTTRSSSPHVFHSEDDHTQTPMDIDGQSELSDEHERHSPSPSTFVPHGPMKSISNRNFQSDHSDSLSDTNESHAESDVSLDGDDDDGDLPSVLTDDELRSKLIYIYNRFTSNSTHDLTIFVTFFKRHQLIDTSSLLMPKGNNGMFTYDLFLLSPVLIGELAADLGYSTNAAINQTEQ